MTWRGWFWKMWSLRRCQMPLRKATKAGALVNKTKGALKLDVARSGGRAASELCFGRLKKELKAYTEASDHAGVRRLERLAIKVFEASNTLAVAACDFEGVTDGQLIERHGGQTGNERDRPHLRRAPVDLVE